MAGTLGVDQLKRLMWLRLVIVTTLLLSAAYVESGSDSPVQPFNALYAVIAATYLLTVGYALALRRATAEAGSQAVVQVVFDLVLITVLVYLMGRGGTGVGFALLYPLAVLSGSVLLRRRQALQLTAAATLLYTGLLALVRSNSIPPAGLSEVPGAPLRQLAFAVFVIGLVCGAVAVTGAYYAESLRSTGRQLEQAVDEVAALKEVNQVIGRSLQSGVLILSAEGNVLHLNAFGASMLGIPAGGALGQPVRRVLGGALDPESLRARALRREWSRFELQFTKPKGQGLPLGVSVAPLVATSQESGGGGYLLVFQDLTEVRRLERQARDNEKLAAVGEVAARLAHEIRNPLGSISGSAQVLLAEGSMSEDQARLLSIITKESRRLSDNLSQFLLQTRAPLRPHEPIDLGPLIEDAVTLLKNGPEVREAHDVSLERSSGAHMCLADPDGITQVFWNLARNGLEAMPDGGALRVSLSGDEASVVLALRDEGRGLGPDMLRPGFQPAASGGLGLAIVYQIVREHRGDISVRPLPPRGTEVEVRLPRLRVDASA